MAEIVSRLLPTKPRISILSAGSGELIVFLHGLGSTKENWRPQLDHFSRTHHAVAWDARGYGESDDYEGELVFERDFVSDLLSVMDLLDAGRAHLVGLSMGGIIAQCFYFSHPERVRSLVLADSFPSFQVIGAVAVKGFLAARVDPLLEGATPADLASAAAKAMLAPGAPESAYELLLASLSNLRIESYVKAARALAAQEAIGKLEDIVVPTLVLTGELDLLAPVSLAREMSEKIPGSELAIIPEAGHISNLERPEEFNRVVSRFVQGHSVVVTELA